MATVSVLAVDDDPDIRDFLRRALATDDLKVSTAGSGREALRIFYDQRPDLVLLDIMMPDMDGYEVCARLRELSDVPIIMLSALTEAEAVVQGLGVGADDYITKPFDLAVLRAKIQALLRRDALRRSAMHPTGYADAYLRIDLAQHRVEVNDEPVALSPTEYKLLAVLVQHSGQLLSYSQLLEQVWGWEYREQIDYLHVYISRLRHKLEPEPESPRYLLTESRVGYRFQPQRERRGNSTFARSRASG